MNESNRLFIVLLCAAWIVAMVAVIFLTWAAPDRTIDRLDDVVTFFRDNNTTAGQLIVTLAAAAMTVFALLVIIMEFAPDEEPRELRIEQAGGTTIIPADALRGRLEEALLMIPEVTAARSHVASRDKGISASVDLTVTPSANVADVSQEATRIVVDTVHTDLGLAVAGVPKVKIVFGAAPAAAREPVTYHAPGAVAPTSPTAQVETTDERVAAPHESPGEHTPQP